MRTTLVVFFEDSSFDLNHPPNQSLLHGHLLSFVVATSYAPFPGVQNGAGPSPGDPISPLLFLLVVEASQISIIEACNNGVFKGVSLAESSGLKVNISKSRIIGVGVMMLNLWHLRSVVLMTLYLLSALAFRWGRECAIVMVRTWLLSVSETSFHVGKLMLYGLTGGLPSSSLFMDVFPVYYLSLFKAPQKVINILESIRCRFLALRRLLGKWKWRFLKENKALRNIVIKDFLRGR
ncbi:hypothetical protein Tco_0273320 [Tanacetum coccineum]